VSWCYHTTPGFEPSLGHGHAFVRFGRHQLMLTRVDGQPCVKVQLFTDGKGGDASEVLGRLRLLLPEALRHFGNLRCTILLPVRGYDCFVDFAELKGLMSTGLQASPSKFLMGSEVGGYLNAWLEPSIENTRPHAFISYRWNDCDSPIANALYDRLSTFDINGVPMVVFLDKERLRDGERFDLAFMGAMSRSFLVVPLVSWEALQRMTTLTEASACDNVLLEWSLAVELEKRNGLSVLPVLSGPVELQADGTRTMQNLFAARPPKLRADGRGTVFDADGQPVPDARAVFERVPKVVVKAVGERMDEFFARNGQPKCAEYLTAHAVVQKMSLFLGVPMWELSASHGGDGGAPLARYAKFGSMEVLAEKVRAAAAARFEHEGGAAAAQQRPRSAARRDEALASGGAAAAAAASGTPTFLDKVKLIKEALELAATGPKDVVAEANEQMGLEAQGALPKQVDALVSALGL
jgi:hypothetical protein